MSWPRQGLSVPVFRAANVANKFHRDIQTESKHISIMKGVRATVTIGIYRLEEVGLNPPFL